MNFVREISANQYRLPHRTTISNNIPRIADEIKKDLTKNLKRVDYCSISSDGWSNLNKDYFLSEIINFVDEDFTKQTLLLNPVPFEMEHSFDNIINRIRSDFEYRHLVGESFLWNSGKCTGGFLL